MGGGAVAPGRQGLLIGTLVYTGVVVSLIGTLGTPLIPLIARVDHVSFVAAQWILTITLLVGAVAGPALGRLGDGRRRKGVLVSGLACVVVGAAVAATAPGFAVLLVGRALMGVGLGLMPLTFAVARDCLPAPRNIQVVAILSVTVASGTGLGYPITGLIADRVDYRVAFWLAAGLGLVAIALIGRAVPRADPSRPRRPFDVPGALLLGLGLGVVLLGFSEAPAWGWASPAVLGLFAAGVVLVAGWFVVQRTSAAPLVELRYLRPLPVLVSNASAMLMGFGMFGTISLVIRLVETPVSAGYGFGGGVSLAGLMVVPLSVGTLLATRVARVIERRAGTAAVLLVGGVLVALAAFGLALRRDHLVEVGIAIALVGAGIGTAFAAMPTLIITHVPPAETGSATSFNQALRVVGGSVGSALAASLLAEYTPSGALLPRSGGYTVAFLLLGAANLLAGLLALVLRRGRVAPVPAGQVAVVSQPAPRGAAPALDSRGAHPAGPGPLGDLA